MKRTVRIGLLGCGVVGGGVVEALRQNKDWIAQQNDIEFDIVRIAVRDLQRQRVSAVQRAWLCDDWRDVCRATDIEVVVEVMGGLHPAYEAVVTALSRGKHVVTANKELLATHGVELHRMAAEHGCTLLYEASVLGGVPVLHGLDTYFRANRITRIRGIVNGTCNYILTRMEEACIPFEEALREAQAHGYAETDPTLDVESFDALFKLEILTRQALHARIDARRVERVGVRGVDACDIALARQMGCRVQQVVVAEIVGEAVYATVGPTFVPLNDPLSRIRGVENGLSVDGDIVGRVLFSGPGAGAFPTASAVVEDLLKVVTAFPQTDRQTNIYPVTSDRPQAYFIRRRCDRPREWLGPLAAGRIPNSETRVDGYVRTPDGKAEGWVVCTRRAFLDEIGTLMRSFDGAPIAWYPFSEMPKLWEGSATDSAVALSASV